MSDLPIRIQHALEFSSDVKMAQVSMETCWSLLREAAARIEALEAGKITVLDVTADMDRQAMSEHIARLEAALREIACEAPNYHGAMAPCCIARRTLEGKQ